MIFQIEHFYRDSDGNDWLPAVRRAQNEWLTAPTFRGFTLLFGPRQYTFSGSIDLIRGMSLVGSGSAGSIAGTQLIFTGTVDGIIGHALGTAPTGMPGGGSWSILERLYIAGPGRPPSWSANAPKAAGNIVMPTIYNGFVYTCVSTSGSTGERQPRWPTTVGATVRDGSVRWRCQQAVHGVTMHTRMMLRDVYIIAFSGDGIHIDASHGYTPPTFRAVSR
jgi:hypothetical protein